METKIIILVNKGAVVGLCSNIDLEYVVVDKDIHDEDEKFLIGQVNSPDMVDDELSLSSLGDYEIIQIAKNIDHPWI